MLKMLVFVIRDDTCSNMVNTAELLYCFLIIQKNSFFFFFLLLFALGGSFVEGEWLRNAFRWKETIGPWEERPGHFADVWMYWTDDGLGYFEFLQVGIFFSSVIQECLEFPLKSCFCRYQFLKILFMQLAEDLGTLPIWVFNNGTSHFLSASFIFSMITFTFANTDCMNFIGISHNDEVDTASVLPFVQVCLHC